MKIFKSAYVVLSLLGVLFFAGQAQASAFLSMDPGESTIREFLLYDEFDARKLRPAELFLLLGTGDNETLMGDLTITLKPTAVKEFGAILEYSIVGIAFPIGCCWPTVINATATAPLTLKKVVPVGSAYALVLVGAYIKDIQGDVDRPVQFSITFDWAEGQPL